MFQPQSPGIPGTPISNVDFLVNAFGNLRSMASAIGVSHGLIWRWKQTGEVPTKYNDQVRAAAQRLSEKMASDEAPLFRAAVENCLQVPVCRECGRVL